MPAPEHSSRLRSLARRTRMLRRAVLTAAAGRYWRWLARAVARCRTAPYSQRDHRIKHNCTSQSPPSYLRRFSEDVLPVIHTRNATDVQVSYRGVWFSEGAPPDEMET